MWTLGSCNLPEQRKLGQMSRAHKKDMHFIKQCRGYFAVALLLQLLSKHMSFPSQEILKTVKQTKME